MAGTYRGALRPNIEGNKSLREPQEQGFLKIRNHFSSGGAEGEVGAVLPVGAGKTGLITLLPFAAASSRTLVVAPFVKIADQLHAALNPTSGNEYFYRKCAVLPAAGPFPEPVEIRGATTNRDDLDEADVVITNIQQLQGEENRWLNDLPGDYFDLLVFDEGHHSVTRSYEALKTKFPAARIVNLSATPHRADGQLMPGRLVYTYPVRDAIAKGYVKRLKALVLNPRTLRYVRHEDGMEVEVTLDEVIRLGDEEAAFRRGIVTSKETLSTIVDASIRELDRIRDETGDDRHKIIASALHHGHCHQIVEAYRARGRRADFVHSKEDSAANRRVLEKLERHELDVIVQVRQLGEGFDHPYLSVAAVFSIFRSLSPFVQFVGRIMRALRTAEPDHILNQGSVVFHAGAACAQRWEDFRDFSEADQEYFDQLLPVEGLDFQRADELEVTPGDRPLVRPVQIQKQDAVTILELPLLENDAAKAALQTLKVQGYTLEDIQAAYDHVPLPTTKVGERQAKRQSLDATIKTKAGEILNKHGLPHEGHTLDKNRIGKTNYQIVVSRFNTFIRERVSDKERYQFNREELDRAHELLPELAEEVEREFLRE